MNYRQKLLKRIRQAEEEMAYASPSKAATLALKIAKWKNALFN